MEDRESFYLTLPSDVLSKEYGATNTTSDYKYRLEERLTFNQNQWEVGLVEFSFRHTWNTLSDGEFYVTKTHLDTGTTERYEVHVREGKYLSISDLMKELLKSLSEYVYDVSTKASLSDVVFFYYEDISNKSYLGIGETNGHNFTVELSDQLCVLLGFEKSKTYGTGTHLGRYTTDLTNGFSSMYIYFDLVEPQFLGSVRSPLLRTVSASSKRGEVVTVEFKNIQYVPVVANDTDIVHVDIRRDDGKHVPFDGGKVQATVHFRRIGLK